MEITARCKFCGGSGAIAKDFNPDTGKDSQYILHCCECNKCKRHTIHARTLDEAIENWNRQRYSEETYMLAKPHMAEGIDVKGAQALIEKILDEQYKEYTQTLKRLEMDVSEVERDHLLETKERCERWYKTSPFLGKITGDEVIRGIKRRIYGKDDKD